MGCRAALRRGRPRAFAHGADLRASSRFLRGRCRSPSGRRRCRHPRRTVGERWRPGERQGTGRRRRMTVEGLRNEFEERQINKVKLIGFDIDGVGRGKYVSLDKLFTVAESGFGFCDVLFGWDSADEMYDRPGFTGADSGYPDLLARVDLDTLRFIPWEPGVALFLIDFHQSDGQPLPVGPRQGLRRVLAPARTAGLHGRAASQYEYLP